MKIAIVLCVTLLVVGGIEAREINLPVSNKYWEVLNLFEHEVNVARCKIKSVFNEASKQSGVWIRMINERSNIAKDIFDEIDELQKKNTNLNKCINHKLNRLNYSGEKSNECFITQTLDSTNLPWKTMNEENSLIPSDEVRQKEFIAELNVCVQENGPYSENPIQCLESVSEKRNKLYKDISKSAEAYSSMLQKRIDNYQSGLLNCMLENFFPTIKKCSQYLDASTIIVGRNWQRQANEIPAPTAYLDCDNLEIPQGTSTDFLNFGPRIEVDENHWVRNITQDM